MDTHLTDSKGRNWQMLVFWGGRLDTELNMPTIVGKMRSIITILTESDDIKEAKELGNQIWLDTEILYHGLMRSSVDTGLTEQQRVISADLAGVVEEFQHLMIRELGVTLP